jgi:hypothetical protein
MITDLLNAVSKLLDRRTLIDLLPSLKYDDCCRPWPPFRPLAAYRDAQWRTEGGAGGGGRPPRAPEGGGRQNGHQSTGARERFFVKHAGVQDMMQ